MTSPGRIHRDRDRRVSRVSQLAPNTGNVYQHGLPDQNRVWSLTAGRRKAAGSRVAPVKTCPGCHAILAAAMRECPECGFEFVVGEIASIAGELVEVRRDPAALAAMPYRQAIAWAGRDRAKVLRVAKARGYKPGWAYYQSLEPRDPAPLPLGAALRSAQGAVP
jgi:Uncharacterised protein family UPF0547